MGGREIASGRAWLALEILSRIADPHSRATHSANAVLANPRCAADRTCSVNVCFLIYTRAFRPNTNLTLSELLV